MNSDHAVHKKVAGNTPERIAAALRHTILQGRFKAGQALRQDQIAEELGVSKIPVREALMQLKGEGLVSFLPNRGAVVTALSALEVDEIYTMRIALETTALHRAIPQLRPADLIRARGVLEIIDTENNKAQWGDLNWEFHATLYQAARMPRLLSTIETLHNNVARYLIIYLDQLDSRDLSQQQHWAILQACQAGESETALEQLRIHLQQAHKCLTAFLD